MKIMKIIKYIVCQYLGHSNILENDFGRVYCARCGEFLGDSLAGAYSNDRAVVIGHECATCLNNFRKLNWRDRFMSPSIRECFPKAYARLLKKQEKGGNRWHCSMILTAKRKYQKSWGV